MQASSTSPAVNGHGDSSNSSNSSSDDDSSGDDSSGDNSSDNDVEAAASQSIISQHTRQLPAGKTSTPAAAPSSRKKADVVNGAGDANRLSLKKTKVLNGKTKQAESDTSRLVNSPRKRKVPTVLVFFVVKNCFVFVIRLAIYKALVKWPTTCSNVVCTYCAHRNSVVFQVIMSVLYPFSD